MEAKSGGLSKGCLVGIIVASAILLLLIGTMAYCWFNKEKIMRWSAVYASNELKAQIVRQPEILDSVRFNAFIDAFVTRVGTDSLDQSKLANLALVVQPMTTWGEDKKLDTAEIQKISDAMIAYFPELESVRPIPKIEMMAPADSIAAPLTTDTASTK